MSQDFQPGDFLIFQLESGYGLLRLLSIEENDGNRIWHLAAYADLFLDVEMVDAALGDESSLTVSHPQIALTNRAFESTQVARMKNSSLTGDELRQVQRWRNDPNHEVSDRSIRLMLGLR